MIMLLYGMPVKWSMYRDLYLSPEQWQRHDDAPIKIEFYLRQLQELKTQLDSLNIPLIVQTIPLWNDIPQFFIRLLEHISFQNIYANIEVGVQ
jgi:deoxyribodipyrimidine photo-lyase